MNLNEAKTILLLYRPGTADSDDPQIAEALALAQREPELARWLADHCAKYEALRGKLRDISVPAGLREQIISEQAARGRIVQRQPRFVILTLALVILIACLTMIWPAHRLSDDTLAVYQNQMVGVALRGYGMDLVTNSPAEIRTYLEKRQAPADYVLPAALQTASVVGCAVTGWRDVKVSMICFRTGRSLPLDQSSDLWLFVVPRTSLKDPPPAGPPRFTNVNGLTTATWVEGEKVYLLGTQSSEAAILQYL